jgi:hypothetical protein
MATQRKERPANGPHSSIKSRPANPKTAKLTNSCAEQKFLTFKGFLWSVGGLSLKKYLFSTAVACNRPRDPTRIKMANAAKAAFTLLHDRPVQPLYCVQPATDSAWTAAATAF